MVLWGAQVSGRDSGYRDVAGPFRSGQRVHRFERFMPPAHVPVVRVRIARAAIMSTTSEGWSVGLTVSSNRTIGMRREERCGS
jgi:hypothetical protein